MLSLGETPEGQLTPCKIVGYSARHWFTPRCDKTMLHVTRFLPWEQSRRYVLATFNDSTKYCQSTDLRLAIACLQLSKVARTMRSSTNHQSAIFNSNLHTMHLR